MFFFGLLASAVNGQITTPTPTPVTAPVIGVDPLSCKGPVNPPPAIEQGPAVGPGGFANCPNGDCPINLAIQATSAFWGPAPYQGFNTKVGTRLVFEFSSTHNLYSMPNKAAYEACDFSQAVQLERGVPESLTPPLVPPGTDPNKQYRYAHTVNIAGMNYFACKFSVRYSQANRDLIAAGQAVTVVPQPSHCRSAQQKIAVNVVGAVPSCTDNIQNQGEQGPDCGGPCASPPLNRRCVTCTDGIKNGDEDDIDCGGSCGNKCVPYCPADVVEAYRSCRTKTDLASCQAAINAQGVVLGCSWCSTAAIGCTYNVECFNPEKLRVETEQKCCVGGTGPTCKRTIPGKVIPGGELSCLVPEPLPAGGAYTTGKVLSPAPPEGLIPVNPGGAAGGAVETPVNCPSCGTNGIAGCKPVPACAVGVAPVLCPTCQVAGSGIQVPANCAFVPACGQVGIAEPVQALVPVSQLASGNGGGDNTGIYIALIFGAVILLIAIAFGIKYVMQGSQSSRAKERFDLGTSPVKV